MSIFSRLRKRGAEDGPPESPPSAPPTPRAESKRHAASRARVRLRPSRRSSAGSAKSSAPRLENPRPVRPALRGNVQSPVAGAIGSPGVLAPPRGAGAPAKPASSAKPPPAPAAAPTAPAPAARAPVAVAEPGGSLDVAIAHALENSSVRRAAAHDPAPSAPPAPAAHRVYTASDEAALRETFEELAVSHVTPIRNAMMEVRFGEAQTSWLELGRPALKSLRSMASEVGHAALVAALDGFVGALQTVLEPGQPAEVTGPTRETLLSAYAPLAMCLPRAFALEGEHDRREPIIVRALLEQVAGLEPLMIDKLMAAGLGTLAQLFAAKADELAAVTGIPRRDRRLGGGAHPGVPAVDAGSARDRRSARDRPRARTSCSLSCAASTPPSRRPRAAGPRAIARRRSSSASAGRRRSCR